MARYKQNLLPDEMVNNPGTDPTPWIGPNDNIVVIGTPEGPRYIRDNMAEINNRQPYPIYDKADLPTYRNSAFNPTEPDPVPREPLTRSIQVNPDMMSFDETQMLGQMMPPGPPPSVAYATNIPETARQWNKEGKIGQEGQDNFDFLTNTPEETAQAKQKGIGNWGKIIGPPEAAITPKKAKEPAPYPGPPPGDEQIQGFKDFSKFWNTHVQEAYGGNDPLKFNPADARMAVEQPLKDQNAQFIYDYETYGAKQMGPDATARYNRLQKQIKEAGDNAEEKAKNAYNMALKDQTIAHDFFKARQKELSELGKMTKEDQAELISIRGDKTAYRRDAKDIYLSKQDRQDAKDQLKRLETRENQILSKEQRKSGGSPGGTIDRSTAESFLRQSGWDGISQPTDAQKNAARSLSQKKGYRTK